MKNDAVELSYRDAVAWIRLNRPASMNALSREVMAGLDEALDEIARDDRARVLVITGNGSAFSAGGNLKAFRAQIAGGEQRDLAEGLRAGMATFRRVETSPRPVIAAVNGFAVAGGLELILCCDIVLAAESAMLGDGHLRYGVVPGGGSSVRLPRKLPQNVANRLLLTGELVTARRMADWGLVNDVVPDADLERAAIELSQQISSLSPIGLACIKRMIAGDADPRLESALGDEIAAFETYSHSADILEGLNAFSEKRAPSFSGR